MRTFWADRHMLRVECVTDQVRISHSLGGAVKEARALLAVADLEPDEAYLDGVRRTISLRATGVVAACAALSSVEAMVDRYGCCEISLSMGNSEYGFVSVNHGFQAATTRW